MFLLFINNYLFANFKRKSKLQKFRRFNLHVFYDLFRNYNFHGEEKQGEENANEFPVYQIT